MIVRRSANLVFLIGIGQRVSQSMVMLLIPLWVLDNHGSPFALGVDVAAVSVAPMILAIPIGAAADRLGSRRIVLVGALAAGLATILSISIGNVWLFGFWQMIAGLGRSATWIGAQASVTKENDEGNRKARRIGWLSLSAQLGNFAGPFLAGLLIAQINIIAAFVVAAGAIGAISVYALAEESESQVSKHDLSPGSSASVGKHFGRAFGLLKVPAFRLVIIGSMVRLVLIAVRNSFYVVFLHNLGWNPLEIGTVLSLGSAASAGAAGMTGALHSRFDSPRMFYISMFAMALSFSLVPFFSSFLLQAICMVLFGIGNGLAQTSLISLLAKATPRQDQGLAVGLRTSVNRAVQVSTPLIVGTLVTFVVLPTLLFSLGALCVLSLIGSAWFFKGISNPDSEIAN